MFICHNRYFEHCIFIRSLQLANCVINLILTDFSPETPDTTKHVTYHVHMSYR